MKKIQIAFTDFWNSFDPYNNYFINILKKDYDVEVVNEISKVQYLFFSCFGYEHLKYNCIKIFYTGENFVPDFNLCDYAIGFEHMDYGDRYIRMPLYLVDFRDDYEHMLAIRDSIKPRQKFCSFVATNNAEADGMRKKIFDKLSEYKKIDAGGRYLNNIGQPDGIEDKQKFQEQYRFSLAIENSSHSGYCTEKIVQAFASGTIPIYWGDPRVGEYFNEKAFINCNKYETIADIVGEVRRIDSNEEVYNEMIKEPVVNTSEKSLQQYDERFKHWLDNIIMQPYDKAYRRSIYGKEMVYRKQLEQWIKDEKEYTDFKQKSFIRKIIILIARKKYRK